MRRVAVGLGLAMVAVAVLIAGCGDSTDNGETESITKAEFLRQANAICTEHNEQIEEKVQAYAEETGDMEGKNPPRDQVEEFLVETIDPVLRSQLEELRALPVPAGEEDQVEVVLESQEEALEMVEDDPFVRGGDAYEELVKPINDYGLTACTAGAA